MSIADKLTYLQTTKQLLKTEINKINNVLDDNSTFRSYPQELFNGYLDILNNGTDTLWSNLEKVSASGEEATLENVETAPLKMVLNGNTIQDGTPTPDTPVEVKVVKGENVVSVQGKNLLSSSGVENCTITDTGGKVIGNNRLCSDFIKAKENSLYSFNSFVNEYVFSFVGIAAFDENFNYLGRTTGSGTIKTLEYTTPSKTSYIKAFFQFNVSLNSSSIELYKLMVNEGAKTNFVPYSKTDYPINLVSKNLFSTENLVNATITNTGEYTVENNRIACDYVKLNTSYQNLTLSFIFPIGFMGVAFYDGNKQFLSRSIGNANSSLVVSIPANAEYCRAFFQFSYTQISKVDATTVQQLGTQLEYGTERTNYVSYFTPIEMCKIGDYKDYLYKNNGKWYVHKEIGKKVPDGSESWYISGQAFKVVNFLPLASSGYEFDSIDKIAYCNYFQQQTPDSIYTNGTLGFGIQSYGKSLYAARTSSVSTVEQFKTWLSTHNTIVYYVLATPTEEEITNTTLIEQLEAISKAKSVKDKTYITQTNDGLPFILDVEAIKEYEVV